MATTELIAAPSFQKYIDLVKDQDLIKSLKKNKKAFIRLLQDIPEKKIDFRYAEGKWTIRQVLQHVIDAERVFSYRALWFARNDGQPLPGFDENNWAIQATVEGRNWEEMIEEFKHLRAATILLFESFTPEQLKATGFASNNLANVSALGYVCSGHAQHHIGIVKERYL